MTLYNSKRLAKEKSIESADVSLQHIRVIPNRETINESPKEQNATLYERFCPALPLQPSQMKREHRNMSNPKYWYNLIKFDFQK